MNRSWLQVARVMLVIMFSFAILTGCGETATSSTASDYKAVVKTFLGAINTQSTTKFLNSFQKSDRSDILDAYAEEDLKTALEDCAASISDEYGEDWYKNVSVTSREKQDATDEMTSYLVTVEIADEEFDTFPIIKVGSKYYMDPQVMDSIVYNSSVESVPEDVVGLFFDSIYQQDAQTFLSCFTQEMQDSILESVDESELQDGINELAASLSDEYGEDWRSNVVIGEAEIDDSGDITYYNVPVSMNDEQQTIPVIQVDGQYYIDESAFQDAFGE